MHPKQHTLLQSALLHVAPGLAGVMVYVLAAPRVMAAGYPAVLALLLAALLVIVPIELGILFAQPRLGHHDHVLENVVLNRRPIPRWQYLVLPLPLVAWGFLASGATGPLDLFVARAWFGWLPDWFFSFDVSGLSQFSRPALLLTFWVGLAINGLALPIVEEYYFRGFLLPRMARFGKWSPVLETALFSLYHFWSPWQFFSRIVWLIPWTYTTWRKHNVYPMMAAHCLANSLGWVLFWLSVLG